MEILSLTQNSLVQVYQPLPKAPPLPRIIPALTYSYCLTRLRLGSHRLETDFGMITTKTPWEQRLCPYCLIIGANHIEDQEHFLFPCPISPPLRTKFQVLEFSSSSHTLFNDRRRLDPTAGSFILQLKNNIS